MLLRVAELLKAITVLLCRIKHVLDRLCWQPVQLKNVCSQYQSINKTQAMRCGAMLESFSEGLGGSKAILSCLHFLQFINQIFLWERVGFRALSKCNKSRCFQPERWCGEWDQLCSHESQVPAPRSSWRIAAPVAEESMLGTRRVWEKRSGVGRLTVTKLCGS